MCEFFHVECLLMKPYSKRRGGATYLLQAGVQVETILVSGPVAQYRGSSAILGRRACPIALASLRSWCSSVSSQ
jgi:hypothetical protein